MKYIFVITIILAISISSYASDRNALSFGVLREQASETPETLLPLLDSLEQAAVYPAYKINFLRSCAYRSLSKYYMAVHYAKRVLKEDAARKDTLLNRQTYMLLAETAISAFRLEDAARYIMEGERYAHESGNRSLEASMLLMQGLVYRKMNVVNKSYQYLQQAVKLLSENTKREDLFQLSHVWGYLMMYYIEDKKLQDAWQAGQERAKVIEKMEKEKVAEAAVDGQKAYWYSKMAYLAYKLKKFDLAGDYCRKFYDTRMAGTLAGKLEINDYLLLREDYRKVLQHNKDYFAGAALEDSLNIVYIRALYQNSKAYSGLADYESAYKSLLKLHGIQEYIRTSSERNRLFDLEDFTKEMKKEYELKQAAQKVTIRNYIIGGLAAITLLLAALLGEILWDRRIIRRKDKKMTSLILQLADKKNSEGPTERSSVNGPNGVR